MNPASRFSPCALMVIVLFLEVAFILTVEILWRISHQSQEMPDRPDPEEFDWERRSPPKNHHPLFPDAKPL